QGPAPDSGTPDREFTAAVARAQDACVRLLAARERSRHELADRLTRREFPAPVIEEVLARLERAGLVDDRRFAEQWVHFRHRDSGRARAVLARELRDKGVAADVVDDALTQIDQDDEYARATELVRPRMARALTAPVTDPRERDRILRRLLGVLARRGYPSARAPAVVRPAWEARRHALAAAEVGGAAPCPAARPLGWGGGARRAGPGG